MKKYLLFPIALFLLPTFIFAESTYVVKKGDTILKIADRQLGSENGKKDPRRYVLAREIQAKNPRVNPNDLIPGQTLVIPDSGKPKAKIPIPEPVHETAPAPEAIVVPEQVSAPVEPAHAPEAPAIPAVPNAEREKHSDFFFVQTRAQVDEYHVKDLSTREEVTVNSQINPGLTLGYGKAVGAGHVLVEAGVSQARMSKIKTGYTLENKTLWLKNFAVGYGAELMPSLHLHAMALMAELPVLVPDAGNNYLLHTVMMHGAELAFGWHFLHMDSSVLGLTLAGEYLADGKANGVKYKAGFEPAAILSWETEKQNQTNYKVDLKYNLSAAKSDASEQHGASTSLRLNFIFPL